MAAPESRRAAARPKKGKGARKAKFPNGKYPAGLDMTKPRRGRRPKGVFGALIEVADALRLSDSMLRDELAVRVHQGTKRQRELILSILRSY